MTGTIGLLAAFAAGAVSFLSPCVLPLVPGYISYLAGQSARNPATSLPPRLAAFALGVCFVLGFSMVFILFGAGASALGKWLLSYRYELNILGGALVIAFGLLTVGLLRPGWLLRDSRLHLDIPGGRPLGAWLLGVAFAFGWTPCIGPILAAILSIAAAEATVTKGAGLLAVYSAGLGIPFLLAAFMIEQFSSLFARMKRHLDTVERAMGVLMVITGIGFLTGTVSSISIWLLETFPALQNFG